MKTAGRFCDVLRDHRYLVLIVLSVAMAIRLVFVITSPPANGDAKARYIATAVNVLQGRGFSVSPAAPYRPGEAIVPLYALFIAAIYGIAGPHEITVKLVQIAVDLLSCLLVAFVAFEIAPPSLKRWAAKFSIIVYGVLSWFTFIWVSDLLTETVSIFLTMLAVTFCILAMRAWRHASWLWWAAGTVCGLGLLTRPDAALLVIAIGLLAIGLLVRQRSRSALINLLAFCIAIPLVLAPWIVRNYVTLQQFQPLSSEYGFPQPAYMPVGYLRWLRTWIADETYFAVVFPPAFHVGAAHFDPEQLPESAFDSTEERDRVLRLIAEYNKTLLFTPAINDEFDDIANQRIRRAPIRFFVTLPIRRGASMWLTGFAVREPTNHGGIFKILPKFSPIVLLEIRILTVLPIIIGGVLGLALFCQRTPTLALLVLIILVRTIFMAYHYAPETRYIVEAYPPMIAACGVSAAAVWLALRAWVGRLRATRPQHFSEGS